MKVGDIVTRRSHNNDIHFMIQEIQGEKAILMGVDYRLMADAKLEDLINLTEEELGAKDITIVAPIKWYKRQLGLSITRTSGENYKYGKVLHIDSNPDYLKQSLEQYALYPIPVVGICIEEKDQPDAIVKMLTLHQPNILVITGHDALSKNANMQDIESYLNSRYYVESIKRARNYNADYDSLVIIAGGCKSYYEALMKAGANFASSPNRMLISVTDPVRIACKLAMTSIREVLDMDDLIEELYENIGIIGGVETRGQSRKAVPKFE